MEHSPSALFEHDVCRWPGGCNDRWAVEVEAEDGYCTFLCEPHFLEFADTGYDAAHGRMVRASSVEFSPGLFEALSEIEVEHSDGGLKPDVDKRKARRKAQRYARRRNRLYALD